MNKPLIVQSDKTILVEVNNSAYQEVREFLGIFSELVKSPEHIHTYRMTSISLWNAASCNVTPDEIINFLNKYTKYPINHSLLDEIAEEVSAFGKVLMKSEKNKIFLETKDSETMSTLLYYEGISEFIEKVEGERIYISNTKRGDVKQKLIEIGLPVKDLAGYFAGTPLDIQINNKTLKLRNYQKDAVSIFYANGSENGGSGVIVMPCGAGKTIVGIGAMAKIKMNTLILTTNTTALKQWKREIVEKTNLKEEQIGEYSGDKKDIKPVTVATYQIVTYRKSKNENFKYFEIFNANNWGFIIYDEVHLLPAPVFRAVSSLQSKRRLGLTATLVREDNKEKDVFALIGPKKYDIPWKELEKTGFIAEATCIEIRIKMAKHLKTEYSIANNKTGFRIASENPHKLKAVKFLLNKHKNDNVLIIGQYLKQLKQISSMFNIPIITGSTPQKTRDKLFEQFKTGKIKCLAVSKVANFAVDLPDANIAIQISGTFGSRQEEAQRLGRILRPKGKSNKCLFYTLVTDKSVEVNFARNRQLFLSEQGYRYTIENGENYGVF
jgi:DNA excision repair protein ERCC-3